MPVLINVLNKTGQENLKETIHNFLCCGRSINKKMLIIYYMNSDCKEEKNKQTNKQKQKIRVLKY